MAIVAILHVLINHPFAVGGYPLLVFLEWLAYKNKDRDLDKLAHRITFVFFIVTTTVGAMTGVGIWLTSTLIAPFAIGSLLRVFFFAWATEWIVFIIELLLIMGYFLSWERLSGPENKKKHILLGILLAFFSWITMAIITAILGFMMNPGQWKGEGILDEVSLLASLFNPIYLPQLAFRTAYSMITGGLLVWFLLTFFTAKNSELRVSTIRRISIWILGWVPFLIAASLWYWKVIPDFMHKNVDVALLGVTFSYWHRNFFWIEIGMVLSFVLAAVCGAFRPQKFPTVLLIVPFFFGLWILGHFERVREFIRKPYVIGGYMYANGVRKSELPVLQRDGMLTYAAYAKHRKVTEENKVEAGRDVFMIACSRCHTSEGLNGIVSRFNRMYGGRDWAPDAMKVFIQNMNTSHPYMPPFPGNEKEIDALIAYLLEQKNNPHTERGVQDRGFEVSNDSETVKTAGDGAK